AVLYIVTPTTRSQSGVKDHVVLPYSAHLHRKEFSMKNRRLSFVARLVPRLLVSALGLLPLGVALPAHAVFWDTHQAEIGPETPLPQGTLEVYSERYVVEDSGVPVFHRRPIHLYTVQGQFLGTYTNDGFAGPIHIDLPPGHYVIATRSNWA